MFVYDVWRFDLYVMVTASLQTFRELMRIFSRSCFEKRFKVSYPKCIEDGRNHFVTPSSEIVPTDIKADGHEKEKGKVLHALSVHFF